MKLAGIVCEYNPFHNGHKYHIEKTKSELLADGVVCVMSGDVMQRGDSAVFPMKKRAEVAVENGADLVLEIPPRFVLQSAQFYAYNAVYILNSLNCIDYLSFGSECGNIKELENALLDFSKEDFKESLKAGNGYAKAMGTDEISKTPNNILGIEYIKALKALNSDIVPFTFKRKEVMHDSFETKGTFSSATNIRELIKNGEDVSEFVPYLPDSPSLKTADELWELISYRLKLGDKENFENIMNISEGLNNRILKYKDSKSFSECVESVSCKRYPKSRIRRSLYSILFNFEKSSSPPTYTRVLALNETGRKVLKGLKSDIPVLKVPTKKDYYNIEFLNEETRVKNILEKF